MSSPHPKHRRLLLAGCLLVILCSVTTLALASRRIAAEDAAFSAPSVGRCVPYALNGSAVLPGTTLAVSPLPGSFDASPSTQISLLGLPAHDILGVAVDASRTGPHPGRLRAYSQGDGASFLPSTAFVPGDVVTVRIRIAVGSRRRRLSYSFTVAKLDRLPYVSAVHRYADPNEKQHFHSRPEVEPPLVVVTSQSASQTASGYVFAAPYNGPGPAGPMIFDEAGNLVWFDPLPNGQAAANLQVQRLGGKPVLTWWQGYIPPQGFGEGEEVIADSSYRQIGRVHAGNGYKADLHDFHLTANDTALVTAFVPIYCDLSGLGGPRGGAVTDGIFQEVDLRTGLVRREWHALDHVPLSDAYASPATTTTEWPFDFFHINSLDQTGSQTLISARNTWAMYELNTTTGQVLTRIGGKHSDVALEAGARTAYQHDAETQAGGTISIFDNGGVPMVHPQSRGLVIDVNGGGRTATVLAEYEHPAPLSSGSQGNMQKLGNGDVFLGWGSQPYFSEFASSGQLLFDAHLRGSYESYRGYRFPWTGAPSEAPAVAVAQSTVYASWNGDTRTTSWQLLAGPSPNALTPVAGASRTGFETAIALPRAAAYVAVRALDAAGATLGTSKAIPG